MKLVKPMAPFAYVMLYFAFHLPWLTLFPFIHSDESWLGGLSRNMISNGNIGVTEPFFNAKLRFPHAIKTLFHLVQGLFISIFEYSPFVLRIISLIVGCLCLLAVYYCALRLFKSFLPAFCAMVLLSVNIQFIYTAHFARSEIFILFAFCLCLYFLLNNTITCRTAVFCAITTGIMIFVHPNSFLLACGSGCGLLLRCYLHQRKYKPLLLYCGITGIFACGGVGLSYALDKNFLQHYLAYGQGEFELWAGVGDRLAGVFGFFARLWSSQGGTYYLPNIQLILGIFIGCGLICLVFAVVMRQEMPHDATQIFTMLIMSLGIIVGLTLMGRFNQTYIVFLFPFGVLLTVKACQIISQKYMVVLITVLIITFGASSFVQIPKQLTLPTYSQYTDQLGALVPRNAKTLGNLNTGFYFDNDALLDYRNLPFAFDKDTLDAYVKNNEIKYIIYTSELDYIYEHRPYYNVIYGNAMFVPQLKEYCQNKCTLLGSFQNNGYGARIVSLLGKEQTIFVYKVN